MRFKDRREAAQQLAELLKPYSSQQGVVVAIPRGGLPIGYEIAHALRYPLEVALIKKIGHPENKEYAIGSVSLEGRVLGEDHQINHQYVEARTRELRELLKDKYRMYYGDRAPISLQDKVAIVTDDGAATGNTLLAAIDLIRQQKPKKIVVAIPVAPPSALLEIKGKVDDLICLQSPRDFYAVSRCYQYFDQVDDDQAVAILKKAQLITPGY